MRLEVGDVVHIDGNRRYCKPFITRIKEYHVRYNSTTGRPFIVYRIEDGQLFDARTGWALKPPFAYYIKELHDIHSYLKEAR